MGQRLDTRGHHNAVSGAATPDLNSVENGRLPGQPQQTFIQSPKRDWLQVLLVVVLFFLLFFLNLLFTEFLITRRIDERFRYSQDQQKRFSDCRPCDPNEPESTDTNCCKTGTDLLSYIQKIVDDKVDVRLQQLAARHGELLLNANATVKSSVQCAVHVVLRGSQNDIIPGRGGYATVRGFESNGQSAFIRDCIQYFETTGQFRVEQPGLYLIVSHLAFFGPSSSSNIYVQRVVRAGFTEPILIDKQTGYDVTTESAPVHNSVAVGVARLYRAGELIHIDAKPADKLVRNNGESYFSLLKLQDG